MSELTLCNFCSLNIIKSENKGKEVTVKVGKFGWLDVYVGKKKYGTSFVALTDHCVC